MNYGGRKKVSRNYKTFYHNNKKKWILLGFSVFLFIILYQLIQMKSVDFDEAIYHFLSQYISDSMTAFMVAITHMGSAYVLIAISILSFFLFRSTKRYAAYGKYVGINLLLTWLINALFKFIFQRERPDILRLIDVTGYSFPSGHSMISMSFYGALLFFLYQMVSGKTARVFLSIGIGALIFLIGLSRVYLGVHYASDVLGGFLAGYAWLIIYISFIEKKI